MEPIRYTTKLGRVEEDIKIPIIPMILYLVFIIYTHTYAIGYTQQLC